MTTLDAIADGLEDLAAYLREQGQADREILGAGRADPDPMPYLLPVGSGTAQERIAAVSRFAEHHGVTAHWDAARYTWRAVLWFGPVRYVAYCIPGNKAIAEPVRKTSVYGDPVGEPTTLREVIVHEARAVINAKDPNDYRGEKGTFLERTVRAEVARAMHDEITAEVAKARALVADEIGKQVASAVANAMKGRCAA